MKTKNLNLLEEIARDQAHIIGLVMGHMQWDYLKAKKWYSSNNPHFGNVSPEKLVRAGRAHKVIKFIEGAMDENSAPKQQGEG